MTVLQRTDLTTSQNDSAVPQRRWQGNTPTARRRR